VVSLGQGKIFKILPTADLDMSASAGTIPSVPLSSPDTTPPPVGDATDDEDNDQQSDTNNEDDNNNSDSEDEH